MAQFSGNVVVISEELFVMMALLVEAAGFLRVDRSTFNQALRDARREKPVFVLEPSWSGEGVILKMGKPELVKSTDWHKQASSRQDEAVEPVQFSSKDHEIAKQLGWLL